MAELSEFTIKVKGGCQLVQAMLQARVPFGPHLLQATFLGLADWRRAAGLLRRAFAFLARLDLRMLLGWDSGPGGQVLAQLLASRLAAAHGVTGSQARTVFNRLLAWFKGHRPSKRTLADENSGPGSIFMQMELQDELISLA